MMRVSRRLLVCCALIALPLQVQAQESSQWLATATAGAFSMSNDEMQNIYGNGFSGKISLATPLGERTRLKLGASRFDRKGDPFWRSGDFNAGDAATLQLTSFSLSFEASTRAIGYPRVYVGAGIDYGFAREKIVEQPDATGNNVGAHFSISPEISISEPLLLIIDLNYRFLDMTFKSGRNRYRFDLSGTSLLLGVGYVF